MPRTPNFIIFNLYAKVFDDRVRQNLARHPRRFSARVIFIQPTVERDLEILALPNVVDAVVSEQFD